jgi:hypothetical protein
VLLLVYHRLRIRLRMHPSRSSKIGEMDRGEGGSNVRLEMILLHLLPPICSLLVSWSRSMAQ